MNILVTGARGFIGSHLIKHLKYQTNHNLFEFNRNDDINDLMNIIPKLDFVYHLAGVNRSNDKNLFQKVNVDLTHIPIPEPWMSSDASIDLYKMGSTTGNHQIAVYNIFDEWDESATWNNASSNTPWSTQSGYLDNTMSPISTTIVNTTYGWYSWDITEAVQQARVRGDDIVRLLFRDTSDPSNSNVYFATSEYCLLYTSPSPRDCLLSRMPSSA